MSDTKVHSPRRSALFVTLILGTIFLITFPPVFLWANTIEPRLFGLPFALVWNIGLTLVAAVFFAAWYVCENCSGALDIEVDVEKAK